MYNTGKDVNYNYGKVDKDTIISCNTKCVILRKLFPQMRLLALKV